MWCPRGPAVVKRAREGTGAASLGEEEAAGSTARRADENDATAGCGAACRAAASSEGATTRYVVDIVVDAVEELLQTKPKIE